MRRCRLRSFSPESSVRRRRGITLQGCSRARGARDPVRAREHGHHRRAARRWAAPTCSGTRGRPDAGTRRAHSRSRARPRASSDARAPARSPPAAHTPRSARHSSCTAARNTECASRVCARCRSCAEPPSESRYPWLLIPYSRGACAATTVQTHTAYRAPYGYLAGKNPYSARAASRALRYSLTTMSVQLLDGGLRRSACPARSRPSWIMLTRSQACSTCT